MKQKQISSFLWNGILFYVAVKLLIPFARNILLFISGSLDAIARHFGF